MCLINVAHEHFVTQTGKKSKPALINFIQPGRRGRRPRKTNTPRTSSGMAIAIEFSKETIISFVLIEAVVQRCSVKNVF